MSGSSEKDDAQVTEAGTEQPRKAKKRVAEGSLDGELHSAEQAEGKEEEEDDDASVSDGPWLPYLKPNMTISMVEMFDTHNMKSLPPHMDSALQVSENLEKYYPLIYFEEFWTLKVCAHILLP